MIKRQESRNIILAKKNGILLLSLLSSIIVIILKIIGAALWVIKILLTYAIKIFVRIFGLPIYHIFKALSLKAKRAKTYVRDQFGENFSRNVIIYGGLTGLLFFVTATNIKARELRPEDVGTNSGLYALLAKSSDYELLIQEQAEPTFDGQAKQGAAPDRALAQIGVESTTEPTGQIPDDLLEAIMTSVGDALVKPDLTATEINPKVRDSIITYVVQEKDTISEIAENFNLSTNTILWANNIGPRDFIKPGQELIILPVTGVTHTITKGDTLTAIASRYRAKADNILEVNKLADSSELKIGAKIVVPDGIPPAPAVPAQSSSSRLADIRSIFKPVQPIAGKLNWPTTAKRITQYFLGWRHSGIDIGVKTGQPIYAAEDGIITTAGWNSGGYGYYIIIDHGNGFSTLYGHNSDLYVKKGERVKKGDVIAASGSTGRSTGPHLHFEVRVSGDRVNPLDYL